MTACKRRVLQRFRNSPEISGSINIRTKEKHKREERNFQTLQWKSGPLPHEIEGCLSNIEILETNMYKLHHFPLLGIISAFELRKGGIEGERLQEYKILSLRS